MLIIQLTGPFFWSSLFFILCPGRHKLSLLDTVCNNLDNNHKINVVHSYNKCELRIHFVLYTVTDIETTTMVKMYPPF